LVALRATNRVGTKRRDEFRVNPSQTEQASIGTITTTDGTEIFHADWGSAQQAKQARQLAA
jgi:hypothetical protein